jgi:signal peptidase I
LFLPGLGHYLAGSRARGVKWFAVALGVAAVALGLMLWPAMTLVGISVGLLGGVMQLAMLVDAYRVGRRSERPLMQSPAARYGLAFGFLVAAAVANPLGWLVVVYRSYASEMFRIPAGSMSPTINPGDRVVCNKIVPIRRWDVVVFRMPSGTKYVKRAVGLPGETVELRDGHLCINGAATPAPVAGLEPFREPPFRIRPPRATPLDPVHLGPDEYFFLGDNSPSSYDSRYWDESFPGHQPGAIPSEQLIGRVTVRYWPPDRIGQVR